MKPFADQSVCCTNSTAEESRTDDRAKKKLDTACRAIAYASHLYVLQQAQRIWTSQLTSPPHPPTSRHYIRHFLAVNCWSRVNCMSIYILWDADDKRLKKLGWKRKCSFLCTFSPKNIFAFRENWLQKLAKITTTFFLNIDIVWWFLTSFFRCS